jgi:tRNA dimethylallyltransferase
MSSNDLNKKIIFVVGSTASGKSQLALELAQTYGGSIINCDSIQFYEKLVIGSAAPTAAEKLSVPHYLYNYCQAPTEMTAGEFVRDFYKLLENTELQFPLFIVGGTGFYVQALEHGMYDIPEVNQEIKDRIESEILLLGPSQAYQELIAFDPQTKVHPNDAYRIGRALEVKRAFGQTMTELQARFESSKKFKLEIPSIKIGCWLEKDILLERVQKRCLKMLSDGLIEEVQDIRKSGFLNWAPLNSVGYFEVMQYLDHKLSRDELPEKMISSTMQLIKKQKTWFKRDRAILWSSDISANNLILKTKIDQFLT